MAGVICYGRPPQVSPSFAFFVDSPNSRDSRVSCWLRALRFPDVHAYPNVHSGCERCSLQSLFVDDEHLRALGWHLPFWLHGKGVILRCKYSFVTCIDRLGLQYRLCVHLQWDHSVLCFLSTRYRVEVRPYVGPGSVQFYSDALP